VEPPDDNDIMMFIQLARAECAEGSEGSGSRFNSSICRGCLNLFDDFVGQASHYDSWIPTWLAGRVKKRRSAD